MDVQASPSYKTNSSLNFRRYCFFGFMVLKYGSLITSGHTAGQGLPQIRLNNTQKEVHQYKLLEKNNIYKCFTKQLIFKYTQKLK